LTSVVWAGLALAVLAFIAFAGFPLYMTWRNRGAGADVREGQAYLEAKADREHTGATPPESAPSGPQNAG
jgi:hypothetical protein